jgi:outer membrane lipoprotein-sorting protein
METTAKNTQSIKSNFTQVKNLNVVSEKITSDGTFRFQKENKIRMEYLHPYRYLLIINQDKVIIKDGQKTSSFSSRSNKLFTVINNIIMDCVQGTALDNKDFTPSLYTNEKTELLMLTPVKKELKEYFQNIQVYLDAHDGSVVKIDMLEPSGDNTVITFTDKQINVPVADSEFRAD